MCARINRPPLFPDDMGHRTEIYKNARQMAREFFLLGSGPGTFTSLYQLYRADVQQSWQAYLHDDWLETRITFGVVGSLLLATALLVAVLRACFSGGLHTNWTLVTLMWLALAGCLVHAKFDFPLQIYSTLWLFLLWCAVLSCGARKA